MANNKTNTKKYTGYSGYKKVKKTVEWNPITSFKDGKAAKGWYHPISGQSQWYCPQPANTDHYVWESVAEFATNVKPIHMTTASRWREPDARMC